MGFKVLLQSFDLLYKSHKGLDVIISVSVYIPKSPAP